MKAFPEKSIRNYQIITFSRIKLCFQVFQSAFTYFAVVPATINMFMFQIVCEMSRRTKKMAQQAPLLAIIVGILAQRESKRNN